MDITDASVIVTGGASGLGAATARRLAKTAAHVLVADIDPERGKDIARGIGGTFALLDVLDTQAIADAVATAQSVAPLRSLVCCAGISQAKRTISRDSSLERAHSLEMFERIVAVNLTGTFNCIRVAASAMSQQEPNADGARGAIVTTSSIAAMDGQVGQAAYSASKAGIIGLCLPIARDLAPAGIRVNVIIPGLIDTPIYGSGPEAEAWKSELARDVLYPRRLGHADEFAALAEHLISNDYLNAEAIRLDAGARLTPRSR
jgi:NAD(P)-dependent dehydrogenase (short-subunit alcohol dehydrogenase family)